MRGRAKFQPKNILRPDSVYMIHLHYPRSVDLVYHRVGDRVWQKRGLPD